MGKGIFRKIIKAPVDVQGLEKKAREDASEATTDDFPKPGLGDMPDGKEKHEEAQTSLEGAVDAENGTATTNAGSSRPTEPETSTSGDSREGPATSSRLPEVYSDVEVCRLLRIRRRKIAEARTKKTRGVDWDCVGLHAGMTMKWIQETAVKQGIVPDFFGVGLHPIQENDGIVSCKLIGTWPNQTRVTVEVVATGEAKIATVRDAAEFHLYDIFDARDFGREIAWQAELNNTTY